MFDKQPVIKGNSISEKSKKEIEARRFFAFFQQRICVFTVFIISPWFCESFGRWGPVPIPGQAIPANFTRHQKGDLLIKQEMQKLLELHSSEKSFLTPEGHVRLRDPAKGKTYTGLLWSQIVARSPDYFSTKFKKIRSVSDYGLTVHGMFVKMTKSRQATWSVFDPSTFGMNLFRTQTQPNTRHW